MAVTVTDRPKIATDPVDAAAKRRAKQQRYRRRQKNGEICLRVIVNEAEMAQACLDAGILSEAEALQRAYLEKACAEIQATWSLSWRASKLPK